MNTLSTDTVCKLCGEKYSEVERYEDYPEVPLSLKLCGCCIEDEENGCILCPSCDNYFLAKEGIIVEEWRVICPKCVANNTIKCSKCGQTAIQKRLMGKREIDGLCYECETQQLYHDYIFGLKLENARFASVKFDVLKNARHLKLMGRLRHSYGESPTDKNKSPFDVLLVDMSPSYNFSLIVIYSLPSRIETISDGFYRMTDFKKTKANKWNEINAARVKEVIELSDGRSISVWDRPVALGSVTDSDKNFCYDGNLYGDMSDFYVIGTMANP